jgi:hypothetical protein
MIRKAAVLLWVVALAGVFARAEEWRKTYAITTRASVRINANDAEIEVRASDAKQVEAVISYSGYKTDPPRIEDHQTGDEVSVEIHRAAHHFCIGICNQSMHIDLRVPRDSDLNLHTGDGAIRVQDVNGNLRFETGDGNVEAHSISGQINADTHDGHVRLRGRFDALDLHTGDGNIEVDAEAGSKIASLWTLRSGDGRIDLRLPSDFAADLDAHTGDGHVSLDFPVTVSGSLKQNSIRGKMNGGGGSLELRTGDGDIRVEKI